VSAASKVYIDRMAPLAEASLSTDERTLLERFIEELRERLGDDLHAVWLFGSRARGEQPASDSDVDVLVLVADASWDGKMRVRGTLDEVARARPAGRGVVVLDPREHPDVAGRAAQDRVVLHRRGRPRQDRPLRVAVSPRSSEFLQAARRRLAAAEAVLDEDPSTALSAAYYAMLYGARAALSERGPRAARPPRTTSSGSWASRTRLTTASSASLAKTAPARSAAPTNSWTSPAKSCSARATGSSPPDSGELHEMAG
jgi:predicted nucleotidyltransferase